MSAFGGVWRRELLVGADGRRDDTTDVCWLQGPSFYVDLRVPAGPDGAPVEGFAGRLVEDEGRHRWERLVDLHPPGLHPDVGTLTRQGELLVETGWHEPYVEHWRRDGGAVADGWALQLHRTTGRLAVLIRVGDQFGLATSAADGSTGAGTQIALGRLAGGRWQITASSTPGRAGTSAPTAAGLVGAGWSVVAHEGEPPPSEITAMLA